MVYEVREREREGIKKEREALKTGLSERVPHNAVLVL